ncbi:MAG: restriction endonuclease subunit S [Senegalia sp. (in: firmicutes)]
MTNQEKNVPELRFPEFDGEWEENKINKFLKESIIVGSKGNKAKKLTVKLWGKGVVPKKEVHRGSNNTQYYIRKKGQLMYGKLDFLNCAFGIVPYELDGYESTIDSTGFDIIAVEPKFILEKIKQKSFYKKYGERANGSRKAKRINQNDFLDMTIYSPKYFEQKKIGEFFSKLDQQIELEEKKLKLLEQQKKGYMQKIFSQEIRFKDDNGNDYPEWESKKFLDIFKLAPSKNNQIKSSEVVENGIIPVVDQGKDIFLGYSNEKDKAIEDFDNVIVYGDHTTIIKYIKEPFIIGGDGVKLLESNDGSLIHYLYILLQYFNVKPEGYKRHYSILKNKMMNISNTKEEQEKIGDFFNELDELIEKQSSKIVVLKQRKKGFLQKMFV